MILARKLVTVAAALALALPAFAAEHVTLRNGFSFDCARRETTGDHVRLYTHGDSYIEVASTQIASVEPLASPLPAAAATLSNPAQPPAQLSFDALHPLLAKAGTAHNVDADLLWSVVKAESNGQVRATSHAGAQGLMQLMPGTASTLGVTNTFEPEQNIGGGAAYLDQMLTRYHDNMQFALAAYNAGPGAVDHWHGIPPYRETRAYVARVIREFNHRKREASTHKPESATGTRVQLALAR